MTIAGPPLTEYLRHAPLRYSDPRGFVLGPYVVERELGRGAMGVVFLARHSLLQRDVALKVLLVGVEADETQQRRFLREAQAGGSVTHPNVVTTLDAGQDQGLLYLAQEFVDGASLRGALPELHWERVVQVVYELACGLGAAHARGLVHRDVKPDNVMIERATGRARLTDFGLVRDTVTESSLTRTGAAVGTMAYMAPEQLKGSKDVGPPADVFALGCILYEGLTKTRAFGEGGAIQRLAMIHTQQLTPASTLVAEVPRELDAIVAQATAAKAERRYPDGNAMAAALQPFLGALPESASGSGLVVVPARAGPPAWALGVLGLAAGLGIAVVGARLTAPPADEPAPAASPDAEDAAAAPSPEPPAADATPSHKAELAAIEDPAQRLARARELLQADANDKAARSVVLDLRPWRERKLPKKAPSPGRRDGMRGAFLHVPERGLLCFGGWDAKASFSDLWFLDGRGWVETPAVVKPPPRFAHAAAWDAFKGQLVVYGGNGMDQPKKLAFTWLWDGKEWSIPRLERQPRARAWHCMTYDPDRRLVYLFGGVGDDDQPLADLWTWDGTEWRELEVAEKPPARSSACMAWDAQRGGLVLFGGHDGKRLKDDLWLFKGKEWTRLKPKGKRPAARQAAGMVATPDGLLLFGGGALEGKKAVDLDDTWLLGGKNWRRLHPLTAPGPRKWHGLAYDADRQTVVCYGGSVEGKRPRLAEVWEYELR